MASSSDERHSVSMKITFHIQGDKSTTEFTRKFDESNCERAVLGLPEGTTPTKPEAGDYTYSGMHDHGPLPAPREGGDIALLIACVNETKKTSDDFLTDIIKKNKANRDSPKKPPGNAPKKTKTAGPMPDGGFSV